MKQYSLDTTDWVLVANCSPKLEKQARRLLATIARFQHDPGGIHPGTTVDFGWSTLTLVEENAKLIICEPDFSRNPFKDIRFDVTCTLAVQGWQNNLLNKLGVVGVPCRFRDKVVLAKGCIGVGRVYLERAKGVPRGDSGWYIGPVDNSEEVQCYEAIYVYQLLASRPELMQALMLPPGFLVVFDGSRIDGVLDADNRDIWPHSESSEGNIEGGCFSDR